MGVLATQSIEQEGVSPLTLTVLGSTGTIGCQTLNLVHQHTPRFEVVALTANTNVDLLAKQAISHNAKLAVVADETQYLKLKDALSGSNTKAAAGESGLMEAASYPAQCIMAAIVGVAGLKASFAALQQGTRLALANKECLVSAGSVFMSAVENTNTTLLPVDSEHSAAFQAMEGADRDTINRIILTASGGPFREWSKQDLYAATPDQALKHPTWTMGPKITIDSATMMNKGLELIEAHHLFGFQAEQLDVIVHPQSIVHCLVEFSDGSLLAHLGAPDMHVPIAYSLGWPKRLNTQAKRLTIEDLSSLRFEAPDPDRFPALRLANETLNLGGAAGAVFNAANEIAVEAFLASQIGFMDIPAIVEKTLNQVLLKESVPQPETIDDVFNIDEFARKSALSMLKQ